MELEDVFRTHQRSVYAYLLRMSGDAREAEELAQETFYRACVAALRFRGDSSVRTWLLGIARRVLLERLRERGRVELSANVPEKADPTGSPDDRIDLERAFASLAFEDREVLMLVDVLGFEPIDAARTLGLQPGTLRVRLHRARQRLGKAYQG